MNSATDTNGSPHRRVQFSLRRMFAALTIATILAGGWNSYQLNWIRQRRMVLAEEEAVSNLLGNYANGSTSEDIAPLGSTLSQRLLAYLGEPARSQLLVYYIVAVPDHVVRDGFEYPFESTDYPKVQRVRYLFPEATIIAVDLHPSYIEAMKDVYPGLAGMISE